MYQTSVHVRLLKPIKYPNIGENTKLAININTIRVIGCYCFPLALIIKRFIASSREYERQATTPKRRPECM